MANAGGSGVHRGETPKNEALVVAFAPQQDFACSPAQFSTLRDFPKKVRCF